MVRNTVDNVDMVSNDMVGIVKDFLKQFWNFNVCSIKKHIISDKDWDTITPLLPEVDARCVRCGYPFTIFRDEKDGKLKARYKYLYDEGGF